MAKGIVRHGRKVKADLLDAVLALTAIGEGDFDHIREPVARARLDNGGKSPNASKAPVWRAGQTKFLKKREVGSPTSPT